MARHTKCTTVADAWEIGAGFYALGVVSIIALLAAGVTAALATFGVLAVTPATTIVAAGALIAAATTAIAELIWWRDYFFDHRLVCLDGDRCAIALIDTIEADGDGDIGLNTVLAPADEMTTPADYMAMFQPSQLVFVDPGLAARGWHLNPFDVRKGQPHATFGAGLPVFHCEIEGTKMDTWTTALLAWFTAVLIFAGVALGLAIAATALGPIGWAIWIVVAIALILLAIFGIDVSSSSDESSASAGPVGSATPSPSGPVITDTGGNTLNVGDHIAILGRHICDVGHAGKNDPNAGAWDELHQVEAIAKIDPSIYTSAPATVDPDVDPDNIYTRMCQALHGFLDRDGQIKQGLTSLDHPSVG